MRFVFVGLIRLYQLLVSPLLPPACRFYPSCSQYALVAIRDRGVLRGGWLALTRFARCHPWNPGGVDFVDGRHS
jgi:putative membrane protein insertion efficiency factor